MEIIEADHREYAELIPQPFHIFSDSSFNYLNEDRCDKAYYLLFKDSKYRLGLVAGSRDNILHSAFSAPFGGFCFLQEEVKISHIDEGLKLLTEWAVSQRLYSIKITLPPTIYNETFLSKQINSLYRNDFSMEKVDLNYAYHLHHFDEDYPSSIWYNARKNLRIALGNQLSFGLCVSDQEKQDAYNVIRQNREARGFPLRMTWEQVQRSMAVMPADFFLVKNNGGLSVAAAVIFHVAKKIVQVIYWGDLPEYAGLKTMNFLSYKVFEYYKAQQVDIVDIGPSTENSVPNFGLCEFKESIGCDISCKFSFSKSIA
jgi:hypothetical protein